MREADSATKRRDVADFDSPAPSGDGTSPSGRRTERLNRRVERLCHVVERKTRMISLTIVFMLQQWPNAMCPWPRLEKLGASLLK